MENRGVDDEGKDEKEYEEVREEWYEKEAQRDTEENIDKYVVKGLKTGSNDIEEKDEKRYEGVKDERCE